MRTRLVGAVRLAVVVSMAAVALVVTPGVASADPILASSTAFTVRLNADASAVGLGTIVEYNAGLAGASTPPDSSADIASLANAVGTPTGFTAAGVAHAEATSTAAQDRAEADVTGLDTSILGAPITATAVSGTATCDAATRTPATVIDGLTVFGTPIIAVPNGPVVNVDTAVSVAGLSSAILTAAVQPRQEFSDPTGATAIAMHIALSLAAVVNPGDSPVTISMGFIEAGFATCGIPPAPTAAALSPAIGPANGGTPVIVTGTGFIPTATTVTVDGVTIPAADVTVTSPTSLTFDTPAHLPGAVDVTVSTANGNSSVNSFTYVAAPTETSLTPPSGPAAGGTNVNVTGTGFVAGETSVTIGGLTVLAADVTVASPTSLSFLTPAHLPGDVTVTATTVGGPSNPLPFSYLAVPAITSLSPNTGPTAGATSVTVTGTGFIPSATSVTIGGTAVPTADVTVVSATTLMFSAPAHAAGSVSVTVTTLGGTSDPQPFTYIAPSGAIAPSVTALSPPTGPGVGGTQITVSGSGFVPGLTTVTIGGVVIEASQVTVTGPTALTFTTPAHAAGSAPITVSTPDGVSAAVAFTYTTDSAPIVVGSAPLAMTGTSAAALTGLALALLVAGSAVIMITRRRRHPKH